MNIKEIKIRTKVVYYIVIFILITFSSLNSQNSVSLINQEEKGILKNEHISLFKFYGNVKRYRYISLSPNRLKYLEKTGYEENDLILSYLNNEKIKYWEFNIEGQVLKSNDNILYFYDKNDLIIRKERRSNYDINILRSVTNFEYNEDYTKMKKELFLMEEDSLILMHKYNYKVMKDGSILTSEYTYDKNNETLVGESKTDTSGLNTTSISYLKNQLYTLRKWEIKYDSRKNVLKRDFFANQGSKPIRVEEFEYNERDQIVYSVSREGRNLDQIQKTIFTFDKKFVKTKTISKIIDGKTYEKNYSYEYQFDKRGNWILRKDYLNGEFQGIVIREFEYW